MKFIKLTKFKLNSNVVKELADKISGTEDNWQKLDYTQYPSIMQMLSDNNLTSVIDINVSTTVGPMEQISQPVNVFNTNGDLQFAPFRVYIPLGGTYLTISDDVETVVIDEPTVIASDESYTSSIVTAGASYMLRITFGDNDRVGRLRIFTGTYNKMMGFAKGCGLI